MTTTGVTALKMYFEYFINRVPDCQQQHGWSQHLIDMHCSYDVTEESRGECVSKKMLEFCGLEFDITDRMHAMIISALTGTPCIAFSNNNYRVKRTRDCIFNLPYIRNVETIEKTKVSIPQLLAMKDGL